MEKVKPFITQAKADKYINKIGKKAWKEFKQTLTSYQRVKLGAYPLILWRKMGFRVAGCAHYNGYYIEMNTNYLYSKDWKEFLDGTILHELGHIAAYKLYGEAGHGPVWKKVARQLGDSGDRCHTMEKPENGKNRKGTIVVKCKCGHERVMTIKKYNRMCAQRYFCADCFQFFDKMKVVKKNG